MVVVGLAEVGLGDGPGAPPPVRSVPGSPSGESEPLVGPVVGAGLDGFWDRVVGAGVDPGGGELCVGSGAWLDAADPDPGVPVTACAAANVVGASGPSS